MKRLLGQKGQENIHRAELEEKHGYDTKYAVHVIRLYRETKELMGQVCGDHREKHALVISISCRLRRTHTSIAR